MILSIHQPAYLPWLGYLDRIANSDVHIFLDSVQLEKGGFSNRNRIKTPQGPLWLTIPIKARGHQSSNLCQTAIAEDSDWRRKHLKSLTQCYGKAPFFGERIPRLQQWYDESRQFTQLADLCYSQLLFWLNEFGIKTSIIRSSTLAPEGTKSDLVLALCQSVGAKTYLSGALGRAYLREEDFRQVGIAVSYQDYKHPIYPQMYGPFLPGLSVIDYWFNSARTDIFEVCHDLFSRVGSTVP